MNTNKTYIKYIVIFLFVFGLFQCQYKRQDSTKINNIDSINKHNNEMISQIEFNHIIINQIENTYSIINSFNKNRSIILKLIPNKNVLIYRYSEYMCTSCVDEDLNLFFDFAKNNRMLETYVLVDFIENRENDIRFRYELDKFNYYRLDKSLLILPKGSTGTEERYFATIINGELANIFFPIKGNTELTKMYFNSVLD